MPGVIAAVVALPYLFRQVDEQIRCQIESRIAEHYPGLRVMVRSAARVEGQGIEARGVSILEPGADDPREAIVHLEELFLRCTTDLAEMVTEEVAIGRVTIRRPTLRIVRRADGTWNTDQLLPLPKAHDHAGEVEIESGTIEILDRARDPVARLVLRDVNLSIAPLTEAPGSRACRLRGTLAGDHLHRVELEGTFDPQRSAWSVGGVIEELLLSPELRDALPAPLAAVLSPCGGFRGRADATFHLANGPSPGAPCRFEVSAQVTQGRLDDPRLPYPLTGILASVHASNDGFAVRNLSARGGEGSLWLDGRRAGYTAESPWSLEAELRQIELDSQLLGVLPESLQAVWRKYWPSGAIDASVKLVSDGHRLRPEATEATIRCLDVAMSYHKFPYRLEGAQGTLVLKNDELVVESLTAQGGGQPIRMSARVQKPLSSPFGWFEAEGRAIPIDQKLLDALDERSRQAIESLAVRGTADFWLRVERPAPDAPAQQRYVLGLNDCSIRFDRFPYPLENVCGRIERFPDQSWALTNLVGTNDTGRVTCSGRLSLSPEGRVLSLRLEGTSVRLEEELRDALQPAMRQVWNDLKPQGFVDLGCDLQWRVDQKRLDLSVVAAPQPDSVSIEPKAFPYRMEKLRGTLVYRDGHASVDRFQAEHGRVTLACNGYCDFFGDGSWRLHLGDIAVDRLQMDRELIQALPSQLRKALVKLDPRGPMDLHQSTFDVAHSGRADEPIEAAWSLALGIQQASVDLGVRLENMHGELTLAGRFDGRSFHSRGELDIESLTFKGFQFTEVKGPFWIDNGRVLFGSWVDLREAGAAGAGGARAEAPPPRPLTARLFDGEVRGDAWIAPEQVPRYALGAQLAQADLSLLAKETMAGQQNLRGRVGAEVDLRGEGLSTHGLSGRGRVWVREANVYELPVMVALLKILSIRQPDVTAFSSADIRFRVNGPHVYLSPINFNGDAISLLGQGQMDFDSNIDLAFHAVVGRDRFRVPIVSPLMGEASRQTMTIKVGGTLQDPRTSRQVLPGVQEALARLQADLQPPAIPPARTTGSSATPAQPDPFLRR